MVREIKAYYALINNEDNSNDNNNNIKVPTKTFNNTPTTNKLSNAALLQLRNVFMLFPLLGKSICRHLSSSNAAFISTTKSLQQIYIEIINNLLENKQYDEACFFLQFLNFTQETEDLPGLQDLFLKLIRLSQLEQQQLEEYTLQDSDYSHNNAAVLMKYKIYESLLSSDSSYPLAYYLLLEEKAVRQQDNENNIPTPFLLLKTAESPIVGSLSSSSPYSSPKLSPSAEFEGNRLDLFWSRYYNYLRATSKHMIEDVITRALSYLRNKRFEDAALILSPFPTFKPLIILLSWSYFDDDICAKDTLMSLLWDDQVSSVCIFFFFFFLLILTFVQLSFSHPEMKIAQACSHLSYHLKLAWYCSKKLFSSTEKKREPDEKTIGEIECASGALAQLETKSFLFILSDCLATIPFDEILLMTEQTPGDDRQVIGDTFLNFSMHY